MPVRPWRRSARGLDRASIELGRFCGSSSADDRELEVGAALKIFNPSHYAHLCATSRVFVGSGIVGARVLMFIEPKRPANGSA
jgi:hypothetical protein